VEPEGYYRVHNDILLLALLVNHVNQIAPSHPIFNSNFNIFVTQLLGLPSGLFPSNFLSTTLFFFSFSFLPFTCTIRRPASPRFDPRKNIWCVGLRPLALWKCGLESLPGNGCLSVVSVVCCQVEVSGSG